LYVGGTVLAVRGSIRFVRENAATGKLVFPTDMVARQRVPTVGQFAFNLSPGHYVIELPRGGNLQSWVSVADSSGVTVHSDLPNMCK